MSHSGSTMEPSFNEALGTALRRCVVKWSESPEHVLVEQTGTIADAPGKHPDILIADPNAWPVAIETSFDGRDADGDAGARLGLETTAGGNRIRTAIAVRIPQDCRRWPMSQIERELEGGLELAYAVHQQGRRTTSRRWPETGFVEGSVADLVDLLPLVASPREIVDETADFVAQQVQWAADRLHDRSTALQRERIAADVHQRTVLKGFATTMVLWLNALLTQDRLHERRKGLPSPADCCDEAGYPLPSEFVDAWHDILAKNWRSIFEPALNAMRRARTANVQATSDALRCLLRAVERIRTRRLGAHINVGAELFPKLSDDRKTAAAFYTQSPAAEFLAAMTVVRDSLPPEASWGSPDLWDHARLADLACGTGTLLRAGYRRIAAFHERSGHATSDSMTRLHKNAMEKGLYGTDISPIAAHLTASSLAALGEGNPYGATHVGWVGVGGKPARAGALEYFQAEEMDDLFGAAGARSGGDAEHRSSVYVGDASLSWVLMNPPYSRTRGGQSAFDIAGLSKAERTACQQRWQQLTRGKASNQAGMAASFLALADQKLRPGGRLGFVLPLTAAFAESWRTMRKLLEDEYSDIVAIAFPAGRALGRRAVSADTGMEEMMLVATKRAPDAQADAVVRCATLYQPLRDAGQAHEIARSLSRAVEEMGARHFPVRAGDDEIGQVVTLEADGSGKPWAPLGAMSPILPVFSGALGEGRFSDMSGLKVVSASVPFGRLEDLFDVGPTHDLIGYKVGGDGRGAFEFHPLPPGASIVGDRALWAAESKQQRRLEVRPTHKGVVPKALADRDQDRMRERAATLFYARNLRWTSQALLVAATTAPVMGGRAWTALSHADERVLKAFALWANSTLGSLLHWSVGQRTHAGRSTTQVRAIRRMPIPLLTGLESRALDAAAGEFDRIKTRSLLPLCQAHADPVRDEIDQAVVQMMALPAWAGDVVGEVRDLWCREPSVHGGNKAALALLEAGTG